MMGQKRQNLQRQSIFSVFILFALVSSSFANENNPVPGRAIRKDDVPHFPVAGSELGGNANVKLPQLGNSKLGPGHPEHGGLAADGGKIRKKPQMRIADSKECSDDVHRFCSEKAGQNNFLILDCLQNDEVTNNKVSDECQNFLWHYKHNLTLTDGFDTASNRDCSAEFAQLEECRALESGKGLRIPCLIEHYDEVKSKSCKSFLNKMGAIIFSDFRYLKTFMTNCKEDIATLKCGRMELLGVNDDSPHSQGQTIECLNLKRKTIANKSCKLALRRVNELKSDDFHHDRPLYYACKGDREEFCHDVKAGEGAVYNCLVKHIAEKKMSYKCREKLELREQEISEDVKIDKMFYDSCKADIKTYKCVKGLMDGDASLESDLSRSTILLCLESAQTDGQKVQPDCLKQMFQLRSVLMQDYKISPELVSACANEIDQFCDGLELGGNTIQCLMAEITKNKNKNFGHLCKAQVSKLLHVANIGQDIRLDRPLQRACGDVVTAACGDRDPGQGDVITCLLENIDHEDMTDECEDHLLQIQYFAVRDFKLDHHLFKACKKDANKLCHTQDFENPKNMAPDNGPLVFSCLHRHLKSDDPAEQKLSKHCGQEVRRVLKERAMRVKLMPEVEDACIRELSDLCSDDEEHKEELGEMKCLQINLADLSEKCQEVVSSFTEEQGQNIELDRILMKACTPMISKFCKDKLESEAMPNDVLDCLIEYKNTFGMDAKCAAGIEHHQLISLKDFRFNHKFRKNCQESVSTFCKKKNTKFEVVACLSELVRNDTLLGAEHRVNRQCRKELRFELLQRGESINLDPEMKKDCSVDVTKFCNNINPGKGEVIECLKSHKKKLSSKCHKLIFKREQDENLNGDYVLLHTCKRMIKDHCDLDGDEAQLLDCLKEHKDDVDFDEACRKVVLRRMVEQAHDFRLNPHLQKACRQDIPKFCAHVFDKRTGDDQELEGKVINCLKKQYANKGKSLSRDCEHEVKSRIKESALDINQSPVVMKVCKRDIKQLCLDKISNPNQMEIDDNGEQIQTYGQGTVVECLKKNFQKLKDHSCKKEIAIMIAETRVDIHIDPLLQSACQQDLRSLCRLVAQGLGRQMSCLLSYLDTDPDSLTQGCRGKLKGRKDLWEYAAQVAPPESFSEFYDQINTSPARNYFLAVMFTVIGIIFIVGITCGRVTKRVRAAVKNK